MWIWVRFSSEHHIVDWSLVICQYSDRALYSNSYYFCNEKISITLPLCLHKTINGATRAAYPAAIGDDAAAWLRTSQIRFQAPTNDKWRRRLVAFDVYNAILPCACVNAISKEIRLALNILTIYTRYSKLQKTVLYNIVFYEFCLVLLTRKSHHLSVWHKVNFVKTLHLINSVWIKESQPYSLCLCDWAILRCTFSV